ncbi:MAG: peptide ABC transporter substrate-binding protein, partial [Cyanobacteria bacterium P01_H01_bin.15]
NLRKGAYPSYLGDWYPDFLDADNYLQPFVECPQGSAEAGCESGGAQTQGSFYYSSKVNDLIAQQRQTADPAARAEILAEIQTELAADVPYIPLWQSKDYLFVQNSVQGVVLNPSQYLSFAVLEVNTADDE